MQIVSVIISIVALGITIYTYFAHDRKLKEQQLLLNELNILKLKKDTCEEQKANIRVSLTMDKETDYSMRSFYNCSGTIRVSNLGKATAHNIRIRQKGYLNIISYNIAQLAPNESREYHETWERGNLRDATVIVQWDDENGKDRSNTIKL